MGPADSTSIAISPATWNAILIMNLESYQVEHVLEFEPKCTGFLTVKDYFIASNMNTDTNTGCLGIWNAKWKYSWIDREQYPSIITCLFKVDDEIWVLAVSGEIHVYWISEKIGKIELSSKDIMITDIKLSPDNSLICGTANGEIFKQTLLAFLN